MGREMRGLNLVGQKFGKLVVTARVDRIDNDGNYEPGNCRWADQATQHANRRKYQRRAS